MMRKALIAHYKFFFSTLSTVLLTTVDFAGLWSQS